MAIYHLKLKNISRRGGKSVSDKVAYNTANSATSSIRRTVAYRVGGTFTTDAGQTKSFANKKGVTHTELMLPKGELPDWTADRWSLWEEVAKVENRVNSRFAKEFELNIPYELSPEARLKLVRDFFQQEIVSKLGLPVDWAAHRYGSRKKPANRDGTPNRRTAELLAEWRAKGLPFIEEEEANRTETAHVMIERNRKGDVLGWRLLQPHVHGLMLMRQLGPEGFARNKNRWIDTKEALRTWRKLWADHVNAALADAERSERVDHRTLEAQGIDRKPLPGRHNAADYIELPQGWIKEQLARCGDTLAYNRAIREGVSIGMAVRRAGTGGLAGMALETLQHVLMPGHGPTGPAQAARGQGAPPPSYGPAGGRHARQ